MNKRRLTAALLTSLGAALVGCVAPGEGPEAAEGKKLGNEMVMALNEFHERNNRYPFSLEELGSRYAAMGHEPGSGKLTFFYESRASDSYELWFKSFKPSQALCSHQSNDAIETWNCDGVL